MEKEFFGTDKAGNEIYRYTITAGENSLSVLNYGATVQSLKIKDKTGKLTDVVLGFDSLAEYENETERTYFGAVCGRVANRIKDGKFVLDAQEYTLAQNNKGNCLHGGINGFDKKFFQLTDLEDNYITLSAVSEDGEEGFPGRVNLSVKYTFNGSLLMVEYRAITTRTTPFAVTNHSYFNLNGKGDIRLHTLKLNSNFFMQVDDKGMANGIVCPGKNTPFDFTSPVHLANPIAYGETTQPTIGGIDHYFFCNNGKTEYRAFGTLANETGSLKMDIYTNQTGAQIYSGNYIPNITGKGVKLGRNSGICIETQTPPASLDFSHLPPMLLHRDREYYHKTGYRFYF